MEDYNVKLLEQQLSLQRYPFVTMADALHYLFEYFKKPLGYSESDIAPFDFALYNNNTCDANGDVTNSDSFKYILGYSHEKIDRILQRKEIFTSREDALNIFKNTNKGYLENKMLYILTEDKTTNPLNILNAVFHLAFSHNTPSEMFIEGIVHNIILNNNKEQFKIEGELLNQNDIVGLRKVQIDGAIFDQVRNEQINKYNKYESFRNWVEIIQTSNKDDYRYFVYFPIYDGLRSNEYNLNNFSGALIGYLGLFCKDDKIRKKAVDDIHSNIGLFQEVIKEAIHEGIYNHILDDFGITKNYEDNDTELNPIDHWFRNLYMYQQWKKIRWENRNDLKPLNEEGYTWKMVDADCVIYLHEILSRTQIKNDHEDLFNKYKNECVVLEFSQVIKNQLMTNRIDENSDYLKKRIRDAVALLDALLEKKKLFKKMAEIETHARKAAVTAVMSRNMSHNIGSHVLAELSTKQRLREIITGYFLTHNIKNLYDEEGEDINSPDIVLSTFNQYLKSRMDFLADLATSLPVIENQKYLYQDMVIPFVDNKLLKERIPGLADFKYDIVVYKNYSSKKKKLLKGNTDICVSIPNDALGIHAFYIIFENFIRNCAKHEHIEGDVNIGILPRNYNQDLIEIVVFSNCKKDGNVIKKIVSERNKEIESKVTKFGRLRPGAWGILEMKVAASYLRKFPVEELETHITPPLLEAVNFDAENILGYRFYLKKPKELLIICPDGWKSRLPTRQSIDYIEKNELVKSVQSNNHQLMVVIDATETLNEIISMKDNLLPMRRIEVKTSDNLFDLIVDSQKEEIEIISNIWKIYSERIIGDNQIICKVKDTQNNGIVDESILFEFPGNERKNIFNAAYHLHSKTFETDGYDYYEVYGSSSNIAQMLARFNTDSYLKYQLCEAFLTKVAIIDERIQEFTFARKNDRMEKPLLEYLRKINIDSPIASEIDLNAKNFNNQIKDKLYEYLQIKVKDKYDFIVIHLGVIERMYGTGASSVAKLSDVIRGSNTKIIVISGRGRKPEDIPDEVLFLPYSTVSQFIIENRSKYHLTQLLYAARSNK